MDIFEKYSNKKRNKLVDLIVVALFYYGFAFMQFYDGETAIGGAMLLVPVLMTVFVEYAVSAAKLELLTDLEKEKAGESGETSKKIWTGRLAMILIMALAVVGFVWYFVNQIRTVLEGT